MRRLSLLVLLLTAASAFAAPQRAIVHLAEEATLAPISGDQPAVIRALQETARRSQEPLVAKLSKRGAKIEDRLWAANALVISAEPAVIEELRRDPAVSFVENDTIIPLPVTTEEPMLDSDEEIVWSVQKINAPQAWAESKLDGTGVTVGLIDTGIDGTHPDLAGKIVGFKDFIGSSTTPVDGQGHGTHCAGSIGGAGKGGKKTGVAPGVKFVVARVFGAQGASTAVLLKAMEWMLDPDGNPDTNDAPRVCSNSWGSNSQTDKSFWKVLEAWRAANMVPSFAAGNAGPRPKTVGIPGGYPHAFASGATDSSDGIASFSSRGPITWDGAALTKPDISAPGHGVISCKDGGGYRSMSGTSMACPHVSGLIALLVQGNPNLKVADIEAIIKDTSVDLGDAGHDNNFGRGRIDARAACAALASSGIAGKVTGEGGTPVAASIKVDESPSLHHADASGKYAIRLKEGAHALVFSAYGYRDFKANVTITGNETLELNVTMDPVPSATLSGRVISKQDGKPIKAQLILVGSTLAPVTADANGVFSIRAPHGSYTLITRSKRFGIQRLPVKLDSDVNTKVELAPVNPLLLVNASGSESLSQYYTTVLGGAVSGYDTHQVSLHGAIDSFDALYPYEMVVWFSGAASNSLPDSAQKALVEYQAAGGRLLISGQDISSGIANSNFFTRTLHAKLVSASYKPSTALQGLGGDPIGNGVLPFSIQGGTGANNQTAPDAIAAADANASPAIRWSTTIVNRYAALRVADGDARAVYFAFGLESVANETIRAHLITASLNYLKPTAKDRAARLAKLTGEAREDYINHLESWLGVHADGTPSAELEALAKELSPEPALRTLLRRVER